MFFRKTFNNRISFDYAGQGALVGNGQRLVPQFQRTCHQLLRVRRTGQKSKVSGCIKVGVEHGRAAALLYLYTVMQGVGRRKLRLYVKIQVIDLLDDFSQ